MLIYEKFKKCSKETTGEVPYISFSCISFIFI